MTDDVRAASSRGRAPIRSNDVVDRAVVVDRRPRRHRHHGVAGSAYPLGATYDGAGTNFSLFSEVADRVELCLIARDGTEERASTSTRSTATSGTPTCRPSPPGSGTGSGSTAPGIRRPVTAAIRASCCSTRTASRSTATSTSPRRCSPTTWKPHDPADRRRPADGRLAGPHHDQRRHQPVLQLGHPTARRARRTTRRSSTRRTSRA